MNKIKKIYKNSIVIFPLVIIATSILSGIFNLQVIALLTASTLLSSSVYNRSYCTE